MLWWHILLCIISIHKIVHLVQSQDDDDDTDNDDESTTISLSTIANNAEEKRIERISLLVPNFTLSNRINNGSEQNINPINLNEPSKQRIIIALAVLCAALAVLLGFLVSIVVCQWLQHDKDDDDFVAERNKSRPDFVNSSHNYYDHAYRQTVKL